MKAETFQQQQSKEVFGITMTEVMLLFVFGFQMLITTMSSDLEAREGENDGLLASKSDLADFRAKVEGALERLGTTLDKLPEDWSHLLERQAVADRYDEARDERDRLAQKNEELERLIDEFKGKQASAQQGPEEDPRSDRALGTAILVAAQQKINGQQHTISDLNGEVAQLNGEVRYLRERKGGRDWAPCWIGADSEVQFIVSITMYEDDLVDFVAKPAWPVTRKVEAYRLGLIDILRKDRFSEATFKREFGAIFRKSIRDRCRHYVYVVDRTISKAAYKRGLWVVEGYFYKVLR